MKRDEIRSGLCQLSRSEKGFSKTGVLEQPPGLALAHGENPASLAQAPR
jgi:hypothetical protein